MTVTGEIMAGVAALLGAATVAAMSGAYFQRTFSLELDTAIRGTAARIDKVNTLRSLTFAVISKGLLIDYEPVAKEYLRLCRGGFLMEVSALTGKVAGFGTENDRLGREFRDIQMQRLQDAREHADELRVGSEEQTRGIQQVAQAITRMEQVTQRTAGSSQASASAAVELATQSRALQSVVEPGDGNGRFRGLRVRKLPATLAARSTIAKQ